MTELKVPPGRAGRLWLDQRMRVAQRSAEVLERKLRLLRAAQDRLTAEAAASAADWVATLADADGWLLRASLLGGQRAIRLGDDGQRADVVVRYGSTMGVRVPVSADCRIPPPASWDGPVLGQTRQAYRLALAAAVRHAVAAEALRIMDAEVRTTRYRLRAVRDRWIPRLERALAEVTAAIEEAELADAARLRLADRTRKL